MEEKQALTGNDFIDAYNLGVAAGKEMQKSRYEDSRASWYEMYSAKGDAEKRANELASENEALKKKVKKLEKKLEKKAKGERF